MGGQKMRNLGPKKKQKLRNEWYVPTKNPEDPKDTSFCIEILKGPFSGVILCYSRFQLASELNEDESITCHYSYDIITSPADIGEREISDEQGEIFEKILGDIILELFEEQWENAVRNHDIEKSDTE